MFGHLEPGDSLQTNNYCFSLHFQKTDHPQIKGREKGKDIMSWLFSLFPFDSGI